MDRARNRRCGEHPLQVDLVFKIHREFSSQPAQ
jgi:hypothetical protein